MTQTQKNRMLIHIAHELIVARFNSLTIKIPASEEVIK